VVLEGRWLLGKEMAAYDHIGADGVMRQARDELEEDISTRRRRTRGEENHQCGDSEQPDAIPGVVGDS
jgi:hypothetical protein